ncbi:tetratricopeptide repeat protein [Xanthobacter pseudotagetidis]|uniref:tetratricopeptide repeat protein n=1 Tax=Xanthobacter pseudotagetidis TaxID=3119911 RepID=UPI00372A43B8
MDLLGIVGTTVGEALQTGAGALLGTRLSDEMLAVRARMAGRLPLPENHDLVRGIRAAHLAAVRRVADAYGRVLKDRPDGEKAADDGAFHASLIAWLDERQQVLRKSALDHEQVSAEDVRHVLDEMVHPSAVEGFAAAAGNRRAQAENRALAELAAACGTAPPAFTVLFRGSGRAGWYDDFALFVNEELKVNVRFRAIFLAAELVDIKRLTAACDGKIAALETIGAARLGAIGDLLGAVQQDTSAIRAGVERLTAQLDLTQREKEALAVALAEAQARFASTQSTVLGFLQTIVGRDVAPDQMVATLFEIARRWDDLGRRIVELEASRNLSPDIAPLRAKAAEAHAAGDVETAERLLAQIDQTEAANLARLLAHHQEVGAEIALRRAEQAKTKRARADAAFTRLDWQETARLLVEAVELEVEEDEERCDALVALSASYLEHGTLTAVNPALEVAILVARRAVHWVRRTSQRSLALNALGMALSELGHRESSPQRLNEAVEVFQAALDACGEDHASAIWASAQNNLGNALQELGTRETGTQRLSEALAANRAALGATDREREPHYWATAQSNLGNTLLLLGQRTGEAHWLELAVIAHRTALAERPRSRVPLDWATSQSNLGNALFSQGEMEGSSDLLEQAVSAYSAALDEDLRSIAPLQWASTQNNLGLPLMVLGQRETDVARIEAAVAAFRAALEVWDRDSAPIAWAETRENLGNALQTIGSRTGETLLLEEAIQAYRDALQEFPRGRLPLKWASAQHHLGNALRVLGEHKLGTADLEDAVSALRAATQERRREVVPIEWARTQDHLGLALFALGIRTEDMRMIEQAAAAYAAAALELTRARAPLDWALTRNNLGVALQALGSRSNGISRLQQAAAAYRDALEVLTAEDAPYYWTVIHSNLADTLALIASRSGGAAP